MSYITNGTTNWMQQLPSYGSGAFTMMTWIKVLAWGDGDIPLIHQYSNPAGTGYDIWATNAGVLKIVNGGGTTTGSTISTGTWYHLAVTSIANVGSSDPWLLYLNGVLDATENWWGSYAVTVLYLGTESGTTYTNAKYAYSRAFNVTMSAAQIVAEMNSATAVASSPAFDSDLATALGPWQGINSPTQDAEMPTLGGATTCAVTGTLNGATEANVVGGT